MKLKIDEIMTDNVTTSKLLNLTYLRCISEWRILPLYTNPMNWCDIKCNFMWYVNEVRRQSAIQSQIELEQKYITTLFLYIWSAVIHQRHPILFRKHLKWFCTLSFDTFDTWCYWKNSSLVVISTWCIVYLSTSQNKIECVRGQIILQNSFAQWRLINRSGCQSEISGQFYSTH